MYRIAQRSWKLVNYIDGECRKPNNKEEAKIKYFNMREKIINILKELGATDKAHALDWSNRNCRFTKEIPQIGAVSVKISKIWFDKQQGIMANYHVLDEIKDVQLSSEANLSYDELLIFIKSDI